MKVVAKTDKGKVRENNQDAYAVGEFPGEVAWAVVCDGMGGTAGGDIASALAVKVISEKINSSYSDHMRDVSIKNMLDSALAAANIEVYDLSIEDSQLTGMGTTVVCALVRDDTAFIAHAGDSRAYIYHNGMLELVTHDHSVVQNLIDSGQITEQEAEHHPNKNLITRALGVAKYLEVEYDEIGICDNDVLILCSDGLSNYVSVAEMANDVSDGKYYAFADRLVKHANQNGGGDNITVVVISK